MKSTNPKSTDSKSIELNHSLDSGELGLRISPRLILGIILLALPLVFNLSLMTMLPLYIIASVQLFYTALLNKQVPLWMRLVAIGVSAVACFVSVISGERWFIVAFVFAFSLKLFELKKTRDLHFMLIAAMMLVGVVLLNFTNMWSALYLFVSAVVLFALFRYQYVQALQLGDGIINKSASKSVQALPMQAMGLNRILQQVAFWVTASIPLTVLLFYTIPRMDPVGFLPPMTPQASIGLSDHLSLDNVSSLQKTGKTVFRVEFETSANTGVPVNVSSLYWRVLTFEQYDGYRWDSVDTSLPFSREQSAFLDWKSQTSAQPSVIYEVMMEPDDRPWLPSLQTPQLLSNNTKLKDDWAVGRKDSGDKKRFRYRMAQYENFQPYAFVPREQLRSYLYFPENQNQQLVDYGYQLFQQYKDSPKRRVEQIQRFIQMQDIQYSLSPAPLPKDNSLDAFVYQTRQGYCEHFASATAFLLRASGIPSRVVGGFAGGEWNAAGQYLIVRQDDAHAWVEYWIEGEGWHMLDPTNLATSVATPRPSEQFRDMQQQFTNGESYRSSFTSASWALSLDALNYQWYQWVVQYDKNRQEDFWQKAKQWDWFKIFYVLVLSVTLLLLAWWVYRQWKHRPTNRLLHEWMLFERYYARKNVSRAIGETPEDYSVRAAEQFPQLRTQILQFRDAWVLQMYNDNANMDLAALRILQSLRKQACKHAKS